MCVINVSNKRKTDKWRKICLFPAGFEPATLCMWGTRDNRYTMETCYVCRLLFGFHITGWLPKKWKKLSSHLGVEPRTFGLEVQRAIHCANGTPGILGSAFSKFIEYTRYWRLDTIYSSRYWKVRYVGIRELPDMIFYSLTKTLKFTCSVLISCSFCLDSSSAVATPTWDPIVRHTAPLDSMSYAGSHLFTFVKQSKAPLATGQSPLLDFSPTVDKKLPEWYT